MKRGADIFVGAGTDRNVCSTVNPRLVEHYSP
jgi:hypothetical protein